MFLEGIEHTSERLGIDERNFVVLSDRKIRLEGKGGLGLLRLYGVQKMPWDWVKLKDDEKERKTGKHIGFMAQPLRNYELLKKSRKLNSLTIQNWIGT